MRKSITNLLLIILIPFSLTIGFAQKDIELMRMLIFEKTNALRAEKGLPELKPLDSLMDLAQMHSENMVKHNFYAHVDHLGQNPIQRAEKYNVKAWVRNGNQFTGIAENIAQTPWFENVRGCGDTQTAENLAQCMVVRLCGSVCVGLFVLVRFLGQVVQVRLCRLGCVGVVVF